MVAIVRAKPRLDMAERDFEPIGGKGAGISGGGVALDEDHVGPLPHQHGLDRVREPLDHDVGGGIVKERRQTHIGEQAEIGQGLVEKRAMLAGGAETAVEIGSIGGGEK